MMIILNDDSVIQTTKNDALSELDHRLPPKTGVPADFVCFHHSFQALLSSKKCNLQPDRLIDRDLNI